MGDTRDTGLIPGLGRSPGGGNGILSSILVWEISWTEEPGATVQELARDRHDLATDKCVGWGVCVCASVMLSKTNKQIIICLNA